MRRTYCLSLAAAMLLIVLSVVSGCGGEDTPIVPDNPENGATGFTMTVTPDTIRRPADTVSVSYFNIQLSQPSSFYAKAEKDWVLLSDAEGNGASSYKVAVRTVSNRESEPRISKVSFYSGNVTKHAYVWQEAARDERITVTPDTLYIDAEKGSKGTVTFGLIDDSEYTIGENSWFSQEEKRDGKTLQITYTALHEWEEEYRTTVTLSQKGKVAKFVLVQKAKQNTGDDETYDITIAPDKHDKDASSERLFSLVSIDRETTITVTSDADWCSPNDANFDTPSKQFKLYMDVNVNMGKEARTATVTVKAGSSTKTCTVTQEGGYSGKLEIGGTVADAVDLGLSVKWASHNIGASSQEGAGAYLAWGELKQKNIYSNENYAYYNKAYATWTNIGNEISGTQYDAARVNWGGDWRMPTKDEMQELMKKCTWEWTQINKVNGYRITGPNGKSIFIPAAGQKFKNNEIPQYNKQILLWTGTQFPTNLSNAYALDANSAHAALIKGQLRDNGYPIRPVIKSANTGQGGGQAGGGTITTE